MKTLLIVTLLLMALGYLSLGLTGAMLFELFRALFSAQLRDPITNGGAWPLAIYLSFLYPLGVLLAGIIARWVPEGFKIVSFALVFVACWLILSYAGYLAARSV